MDYKVESNVKKSVYSDAYEIASAGISWDKLSGKSVLITGAGGFIGYYLVLGLLTRNDLHDENITVYALVRNEERAKAKYGALLERDDLKLCVQDVAEKIAVDNADFVIHAASQASNIQFENDPVGTINANLMGTSNVLEFAREKECESTLIISSLKVYGKLQTGKSFIQEDDIGYVDFTSYKNCYAEGKRASETLAACYAKQYGMNIKIARPSYIYGASSLTDDRVWAQFIANVVRHENILLKSSGAVLRSFCYVTDTVTAMLTILLDGENAVPYNISNKASDITIRGFAQEACRVFPERNITLSFADPKDEPEPDMTKFDVTPEVMDNSRLLELGWEPSVDLAEGIRRSVAVLEEDM